MIRFSHRFKSEALANRRGLAVIRRNDPIGKEWLMIRKALIATALAAMTLTATACNTVRGIGDDLKSAADAVDEET